jgi:hypothetical protein
MNQQMLFESGSAVDASGLVARARKRDPETSKQAAEKVDASGAAATDRARIYGVLKRAKLPLTGGEIADDLSWDNTRVMRRMKEMELIGVVERCAARACRAKRTNQLTWKAT